MISNIVSAMLQLMHIHGDWLILVLTILEGPIVSTAAFKDFMIIASIFLSAFLIMFGLLAYDLTRKRTRKYGHFVSFIIPVYNDGGCIGKCIESIDDSCKGTGHDIVVINDASTDNTLQFAESLKKKYNLRIVSNKKNLGKSLSLNKVIPGSKGDIVFVVDADTLLNRKAFDDILARFDSNPRVAAVSCPYTPLNKGFLSILQRIEYNFTAVLQASYNPLSTIALWGDAWLSGKTL